MADDYSFDNFGIDTSNPTGNLNNGVDYSTDTGVTAENATGEIKTADKATQEGMQEKAVEMQQEADEDKQQRFSHADQYVLNHRPYIPRPSYTSIPQVHALAQPTPKPTFIDNVVNGVKDTAMDVYRNIFNNNAQSLSEAQRYAPTMGVSAQYLADNPEMLERARNIYNEAVQWEFLSGQPFSAQNIDQDYPEVAQMRKEDPVGAALALKNYKDVNDTRNVFQIISDTANSAQELFVDAYNSGSDMVKLYDAQYKALENGDIDAVKPEVDEITKRLKEYQQQDRPESGLGKIVYDTIQQLTIMGTQGLRGMKRAEQGMALAMLAAAPGAAAAGSLTVGSGALAIEAGAGVTGAIWGLRTGFFEEVAKQSAADRYWDLMSRKDANGNPIFTRKQAVIDSATVGAINGAIELGLLEFGYAPIKAAFGKETAAAILKDGAAQKAIIDSGKIALARMATVAGAKQWARASASELAEQAAQTAVSDLADNAEYYINGRKGKFNTVSDVINHVVDSMVDSVPAVVGMGAMGAFPRAAGQYHMTKALASAKVEDWRQEYQRNVEQHMVDQLIANKADNKLAKEQPEVYSKVIQTQADKTGNGIMYVDAQELARTPKGVEVLNDAVKRGMVTEEQVDQSISNGTDIEIKTGVFTQLADDSFDTKTMMDATTMNKGGVHLAALRERATRLEAMRKELADLASNKSDALSNEIMTEHFGTDDEDTQAAARDVVYRNPYDLSQSHKEATQEALQQYRDLINFDYYDKYEPQGVSFVSTDAEGHDNVQTGRGIRLSNNEPWYSDAYKTYGSKPTKAQLLDIAYENERKEHSAYDAPEQYAAWDDQVQEARKKYETLVDMKDRIDELSQSDYALRKTLSKEGVKVYTDAVKTMQQGPEQVSQAAKENAYIYTRMAETWAKIRRDYGDTAYTAADFAKAHPIVLGDGKTIGKNVFGEPITNRDIKLDEKAPLIEVQEKYSGMDWKDLRRELPGTVEQDIVSKKNDKGEYIPYVHEQTGNKVIITKRGIDHFKASATSNTFGSKERQNTLHYEMIEAISDIIKNGIWVEEHMDIHGKAASVSRILAPVKMGDSIYAVKLTVKKSNRTYKIIDGEYSDLRAYDISTQKKDMFGSISTGLLSNESKKSGPVPNMTFSNLSIREFLKNVKDNQGKPYVNADGTANYGIYFGDNKTGGVMFIENKEKPYEQRAWNGTPHDSDSLNVIEKYNQEHNSKVKAAYDSSTGIVHLFDAADQSSFVHESAHLYLNEMERMVTYPGPRPPEQLIKDYQVIHDWASYKPELLEEYKGTNREREFNTYAKDIEDARKSGYAVAIKDAEQRWKQERFARAFERYLADGKAPIQELQGPFRKFKNWLVNVYRDLKNLGKEPPEDVKRVMDRMLATDDDIENWAKMRELNAWDRKGFSGDLSGAEGSMIKKWSDKIKEQMKEKLLAEYLHKQEDEWQTSMEQSLEQERLDFQKQLSAENEIYKIESLYWGMPEKVRDGVLEKYGYKNEADLERALKEAGGTMEERTNIFMDNQREMYNSMMPTQEDMRQAADAELASTNGQAALSQLEAAAMRRKLNGYIAESVKAMRDLDKMEGKSEAEVTVTLREMFGIATPEESAKAMKGRISSEILEKNERIRQLKERLKQEKESGKEKQNQAKADVASVKAALKDVIKGLNTARDVTAGSYMKMLKLAHEQLGEMKVSDATTWRHWEIKAKSASHRADVHMSAGNWLQAVIEKGNSQKYYCMARAAKDNQEYVRKALEGEKGTLDNQGQERYGIKGILNRISRSKEPIRLGVHSRYFVQHLAYVLDISSKDGRPPLDENGVPSTASFNWEYIYRDLSPDYATGNKDTAPHTENIVAPWIRNLMDGNEKSSYKDLTINQFKDIVQAINTIYQVSKRDYEATTITDRDGNVVGIEAAAKTLASSVPQNNNFNPLQEQNAANWKSRSKEKLSDAMLALTKIETILKRLGPDWVQYIYEPINKAAGLELKMKETACREFARIHNMYSTVEWQHMRNDKLYAVGATDKFTREQIIVMALNWGNKEGRQRVLDSMNKYAKNEREEMNVATMEDIFARTLTQKDWNFIEAIWQQIDGYWPERNKVQERLYGVGLGQVQAVPFTINGRKMNGGYYPIVYDPKLNVRSAEISADDIIRNQLSGASTMAIGMGSTKSRVKVVKNQQLALTLDVWPHAVNEAIHHITMREAVTDVYKLINHPDVQRAIQENIGMESYSALKQWGKDCWKTEVQKQDNMSRFLERMRRNTAFAVMAYRTSTAALNLLNVFPMAWRIGPANAAKAMVDFGFGFYKGTSTYTKNRQFVMNNSPMMRERINTIDRDMQQDMRIMINQNTSMAGAKFKAKRDVLNRYGYWFITETDLMCSMALWKHSYETSLRKQIDMGRTTDMVMKVNAVADADQAVRDVFGSGSVKDQAEIQRKNTLIGQLTPFYSYSNTVLNAMIDAGYKWKDNGQRMPMLNAMLFWVVMPTAFETLYRSAVSGDLDDPDKVLKKLGITAVRNLDQGIPIVRDALEGITGIALGDHQSTKNNALAVSLFEEIANMAQSAVSKNRDWTDIGRYATRAANRYVGFSDTLTDGFWSLARFSMVDTDRSVTDLANSIIFDRRYKTAEERKRADKKKENEKKKQ